MNLRFLIITLVLLLISSFQVHAQTSQTPITTGLSASFFDYKGPITGDYTNYKAFNPGITISANAFLTRALNFGLNTTFVPQADYPINNGELSYIGTSMIDVNAMLQLKSNGTIFKEDAFFAPYLSTGFGLNTASNNVRLYIPGALGIRLRMSKNFSLMFEGMYKYGFGEGKYQPLAYSAGFVFALPANPKPVNEPRPNNNSKEKPIAANLDSDNDGVLDRDDLCPDEAGKAMFLGCPEDESAKQGKPGDIALEDQGAELKTDQESQDLSIVDTSNGNNEMQSAEIQPYSPQETNPAEIYENDTYNDNSSYSDGVGISPADQGILNMAMENIYFKKASDELTAESYPVLDQLAEVLAKYPEHSLDVMGYTDNAGNSRNNKVLSVKRAYKVKYYLVYQKGIRMARITSDGNGAASPVGSNDSEDGRAKNRRVELKMSKTPNGSLGLRAK